jgi:hypothetical protein
VITVVSTHFGSQAYVVRVYSTAFTASSKSSELYMHGKRRELGVGRRESDSETGCITHVTRGERHSSRIAVVVDA